MLLFCVTNTNNTEKSAYLKRIFVYNTSSNAPHSTTHTTVSWQKHRQLHKNKDTRNYCCCPRATCIQHSTFYHLLMTSSPYTRNYTTTYKLAFVQNCVHFQCPKSFIITFTGKNVDISLKLIHVRQGTLRKSIPFLSINEPKKVHEWEK